MSKSIRVMDILKIFLEYKKKKLNEFLPKDKIIGAKLFTFDRKSSDYLARVANASLTPEVLNYLSAGALKTVYDSLTVSLPNIEHLDKLFDDKFNPDIHQSNLEYFIKYRSTALFTEDIFYRIFMMADINLINNIDISNQQYMQKLPANDHAEMLRTLIKSATDHTEITRVLNDYFSKWKLSKNKQCYILQGIKNSSFHFNDFIDDYFKGNTEIDSNINKLEIGIVQKLLSADEDKRKYLVQFRDIIPDLCLSKLLLKENESIIATLFSQKQIKIDKEFMKLIFLHFALNEKRRIDPKKPSLGLTYNIDDPDYIEFRDYNMTDSLGVFYYSSSRKLINTSGISEDISKNIPLLNTIFHELEHENQEKQMMLRNPSIVYLPMIKDHLLSEKITNYVGLNYSSLSYEFDADQKALRKTLCLLEKHHVPFLFDCKDYPKYQNTILRKSAPPKKHGEGNSQTVDELFDLLYSAEEIMRVREKFLLLRIEYDGQGKKINFESIKEKYELLLSLLTDENLTDESRIIIEADAKTYAEYIESQQKETAIKASTRKT